MSPRVAALKLGIEEEDLKQIEAGTKKPTLTVLKRMSSQYRLPLATLLQSRPPKSRPLPTDHRTVPGTERNTEAPVVDAIRQAQDMQELATELVEDFSDLAWTVTIPRTVVSRDPEELGRAERTRFGLFHEDQLRFHSMSEAFRLLREGVQGQGVLVFVLPMDVEDCRGFSLWDAEEFLPAIVVNKNDPHQAKSFTLFHEYAHLLLRQASICEEFQHGLGETGVETFCNRFAAAFLMPVEAIAAAGGSEHTTWDLSTVSEVARRLRVSRQAFALRLVQLHWAPMDLYRRVARATMVAIPEIRKEPDKFGRYHIMRLHAVGTRYARLVVAALDRGYIDNAHANRMLGTKEQSLGALVEHIHGKRRG